MDLFKELDCLEQELNNIKLAKNNRSNELFLEVIREHQRKVEELACDYLELDYCKFNEIIASNLKEKTKEMAEKLNSYDIKIDCIQKRLELLKKSISYYSTFSVRELLDILNAKQETKKIVVVGSEYFLAPLDYDLNNFYELINSGEIIKVPDSLLIRIYDTNMNINESLKNQLDDELLEFINYIIEIKHQSKYMMISDMHQKFLEKSCNQSKNMLK